MRSETCHIAIIGAGAAGLMAAARCGRSVGRVVVLERNSAAGRKLLLTGGGRCNLTHLEPMDALIRRYGPFGRFLKHSLYAFSPQAAMDFLADLGAPCRVEPDGCVFPKSDRAAAVVSALMSAAKDAGAAFWFGQTVRAILPAGGGFVVQTDQLALRAEKAILAVGGASYPQTGSRGDGYALAAALGHRVIAPKPAVCPVVFQERWLGSLQGLSVEHIVIRGKLGGKPLCCAGAAVITANGIGGPAAMDFSWLAADALADGAAIETTVDWLADIDQPQLHQRLIDACAANPRRRVGTVVGALLAKSLAGTLAQQAGCADTPANQLTAGQRRALVETIKRCRLTAVGTAPLAQATITRGGVATDEIDAKTMQSKRWAGLFFAGEVIDADGPCGGYNLQIAWSTAALAAASICASY